jgi:hypothetical protein
VILDLQEDPIPDEGFGELDIEEIRSLLSCHCGNCLQKQRTRDAGGDGPSTDHSFDLE